MNLDKSETLKGASEIICPPYHQVTTMVVIYNTNSEWMVMYYYYCGPLDGYNCRHSCLIVI